MHATHDMHAFAQMHAHLLLAHGHIGAYIPELEPASKRALRKDQARYLATILSGAGHQVVLATK